MCKHCGSSTRESSYGAWCDTCNGVSRGTDNFYVRAHYRVSGDQVVLVMYDNSLGAFTATSTRLVPMKIKGSEEYEYRPKVFTFQGTLDEMVEKAKVEAGGTPSTEKLL